MAWVVQKTLFAAAAAMLAAGPVAAAEPPPVPDALIRAHLPDLREIFAARVITMSIQAQNDRRKGLGEAQIKALDDQWRAETDAEDQPLIAATLTSPASAYLTQVQARSGGLYNALFAMDVNGLNVGQSVPTSDYWQGDEAKFLKTFPVGPDAVFIDAPEYDDGLRAWIVQVSLTVSQDGRQIGAATVDLNIGELTRRHAGQ